MQWDEMDTNQRNNLVGKLIEAKPLTQLYVAWKGHNLFCLPFTDKDMDKALQQLADIQGDDERWDKWLARNRPTLMSFMRHKLEIRTESWHIRYSDTPGGGWDVIEALRAKGARIVIESESNGTWSMRTDLDGRSFVWCAEPSIAVAACRSAVALLSPNTGDKAL